ncbi:MAG: hypothetical protein QGF67_03100 [Lentisphaeria bacterium]|jgi:hypothetical protein|nr:hypothetical protein [Lentisphaeria bacterium]MDP7740400.1 hypothetical protein [Lentisphaeria bacterium]
MEEFTGIVASAAGGQILKKATQYAAIRGTGRDVLKKHLIPSRMVACDNNRKRAG